MGRDGRESRSDLYPLVPDKESVAVVIRWMQVVKVHGQSREGRGVYAVETEDVEVEVEVEQELAPAVRGSGHQVPTGAITRIAWIGPPVECACPERSGNG